MLLLLRPKQTTSMVLGLVDRLQYCDRAAVRVSPYDHPARVSLVSLPFGSGACPLAHQPGLHGVASAATVVPFVGHVFAPKPRVLIRTTYKPYHMKQGRRPSLSFLI